MNSREPGYGWTMATIVVVMVVLYVHFSEALAQRDRAVDRAETIATKAHDTSASLIAQMGTWASQGYGQRSAMTAVVILGGIVLTVVLGIAVFLQPHLSPVAR